MLKVRNLAYNERIVRRQALSNNVTLCNNTATCKIGNNLHKTKNAIEKPLKQEIIKFGFKVSKGLKHRKVQKSYPSKIVSPKFECNLKRLNYSAKELKKLLLKWPLNFIQIKFHMNGQIYHKNIHLDWHRMDELSSALFLNHLKRLYCMRVLKIGGISLTDDIAKRLRKLTKDQWRIKSFSLFANVSNFTARGRESLLKSFRDIKNLRSLSLAAIRQSTNDDYMTLFQTVLSEDVAFLYKKGCRVKFGNDSWKSEMFRNREQTLLFTVGPNFLGERELKLSFYPRNHLVEYLRYLIKHAHLVSHIKKVSFSMISFIPQPDAGFFEENFRTFGQLIAAFSEMQHVTLNFSHNYVGDAAFKILFDELEEWNSAQNVRSVHLGLQQNKLTSKILPQIGSFLRNMKYLKRLSLNVGFNELGDNHNEDFTSFSRSIEGLKNLKSLEIESSKADLSDKNVNCMTSFLRKTKNLETLTLFLSENRISDKGLKDLCEMISEIETLDSLYLYVQNQRIQLSDSGLSMILEKMNDISKIALDLSQSSITENGLSLLLGKLKKMEMLKYFSGKFQDTCISKEGLIELSHKYKKISNNKKLTFDITSKTIPKRSRDIFEESTLDELKEEVGSRKLKKIKTGGLF